MRRNLSQGRNRGFTLIELMISMTILAFIALAVYQNTAQSFKIRDSVEQDGDFYNSIRVALDILGRDIQAIYSPQADAFPGNVGVSSAAQSGANPAAAGQAAPAPLSFGPPTNFWADPINQEGLRPSRLQGESDKLSFIANNHMRLFRDTAECDFAKISYAVEDEKPPKSAAGQPVPKTRGKILVKRENPKPFDEQENDEDAVKYTLLNHIKNLEFKYLDAEKDNWSTKWDNTGLVNKGVFPAVIKVSIELYSPNSESTFKVEQLYRAELPL